MVFGLIWKLKFVDKLNFFGIIINEDSAFLESLPGRTRRRLKARFR